MPTISHDTASQVRDFAMAEDRTEDFGDYLVTFVKIRQDHDLVQALSGLPDGRCPCPHWGYLFKGEITVNYADHDEVVKAGQAFYLPPGHVPAATAGSEFVQFSPKDQLAATMVAIHAAMQARA